MPGCYNFDPLGLYGLIGADASGRKGMRELETAHGRFAMVAISVWAFLEPMTQASSARRAPLASRSGRDARERSRPFRRRGGRATEGQFHRGCPTAAEAPAPPAPSSRRCRALADAPLPLRFSLDGRTPHCAACPPAAAQKPVTKTFAFFFKPFWVVLGDIFNGLVSTGK